MLHGYLRPGYDYLLERKLTAILREAAASPLAADMQQFLAGAEALGYSVRARTGMASEVAVRMLIETGRPLAELTDADFAEFTTAITEREARTGRELKHYHHAVYASRAVVYHLGAPAEPVPKRSTPGRWSWERHLDGVPPQIRRPMTAYLERLQGTHARSSVQGTASDLAHFGRFLARHDPQLPSLSALGRQSHIEPYLNEVAAAVNHRTGARSPPPPPRAASWASASSWTPSPSGTGPRPRAGGLSSPATRRSCRTRCPAICPRIMNAPCWKRWSTRRTGYTPTRCCCCGPPACASASSSTWSWTACTRSPGRARG